MTTHPYAGEELLTFDRIKRAVTSRVVEVAEKALEEGAPLDRQRLSDAVAEEWKAMKEAVRQSPAAKERARERLRLITAGLLEGAVNKDKAELESFGVKEKYL